MLVGNVDVGYIALSVIVSTDAGSEAAMKTCSCCPQSPEFENLR
jgi:hypothetical protein